MGECPPNYSIERKDNDGNYEPTNCIWIPLRDQYRNTSRTKLTADIANDIRLAYARGAKQKDLASQYGLTSAGISVVVNGKVWPRLLGEAVTLLY